MRPRLKVTKPTFAGNAMPLRVGKVTYGIPPGCRVAHPAGSKKLAYVALYDGSIHAFIERGEIELSTELQQAIRRRYFQRSNKNQELGSG